MRVLAAFLTPEACLPALSKLRIEIEERIETRLQLFFDLILTSFEHVHRHMRLASVFELEGCVPNFRDFLRGKHPQSIHQG